jgi:hypothetical protein
MEECRVKYTAIAGHNGKWLVWEVTADTSRTIATCDSRTDAFLIAQRLNLVVTDGMVSSLPGTNSAFTMIVFNRDDVPVGSLVYADPR